MAPVKVIATGYRQQRLIIDQVDKTTAYMTQRVLNDIEAKTAPELAQPSWFYQAVPDDYELKGEAA